MARSADTTLAGATEKRGIVFCFSLLSLSLSFFFTLSLPLPHTNQTGFQSLSEVREGEREREIDAERKREGHRKTVREMLNPSVYPPPPPFFHQACRDVLALIRVLLVPRADQNKPCGGKERSLMGSPQRKHAW